MANVKRQANEAEKRLADDLGLERNPGSGAGVLKGDLGRRSPIVVEMKNHFGSQPEVRREWFHQLEEAANRNNKDYAFLCLEWDRKRVYFLYWDDYIDFFGLDSRPIKVYDVTQAASLATLSFAEVFNAQTGEHTEIDFGRFRVVAICPYDYALVQETITNGQPAR